MGVGFRAHGGTLVAYLGNGTIRFTTRGAPQLPGIRNVRGEEIAGVLSELFGEYAADRRPGEAFGDFGLRAQPVLA